ncbi:Serine/threonine-protein phosphatase-like protein [Hapsidospora chrysogenum ATCC 11550]|uniref:Serine/threonine-protein phosphatase-like protein n=1 Tax=Hapsidospora chrysogenum (strain ATCC 11550 / CBS 779.69 / DSM 880 / IAM 14645 / JCM 23072 / IMI 49137) TaxID=857340 RepID=A0A086SY76_HAPC1|nr:Serine/threonine-protein phosphatase-like protein [Hapsidospora chrysogenum ATCC 11550]
MIPGLSSTHRRVLFLAATAFFLASAYLCVTRLWNMSFTRESFRQDTKGTTGSITGAGAGVKTDKTDPIDKPADVKLHHADLPMVYGEYNRPALDGITLVDALPDEYIPTWENRRRLIIIGDIHGMDTPLDTILGEIPYDEERDHIISTGDMISKGPDSGGVVSRLMALNASAVRGNHEDRVLLSHRNLKAQFGVMADLETTDNEERRGELEHLVVARELSDVQFDWLAGLPVILTVEPLSLYVVHGGLVPGVDISKQDPWAVMNMRSLVYPREALRKKAGEDPRRRRRRRDEVDSPDDTPPSHDDQPASDIDTTHIIFDRQVAVPSDSHQGDKWSDAWNAHQQRLPHSQRRTVVYGHDAKAGYRESRYTFGLDSGCVGGEFLSALVIEATEGGGFNHSTTQVRCQNFDRSRHDA